MASIRIIFDMKLFGRWDRIRSLRIIIIMIRIIKCWEKRKASRKLAHLLHSPFPF